MITTVGAAEAVSNVGRASPGRAMLLIAAVLGMAVSGCSKALQDAVDESSMSDIPRELQKASIPLYRVEPPDILSIEIVNNIRPAKDPLRAGDVVLIRASGLMPIDPMEDEVEKALKQVNGEYLVQTDGTVDLGPHYGSVLVEGMTPTQARIAVERHFREVKGFADPHVGLNLPNVNGKQLITGEHLVRPDGTVNLGIYGSVYVAGMTLDEVRQAVEAHLAHFIHMPEIAVDVLSYNSKVVYVITDGGGNGEQVVKLPFTGNETVLDAIASIEGLSQVSSKKMWVARPAPNGVELAQTMPVDYRAITQDGITTTNYQLLPGDRVYIKADCLIAADNFIAKVVTPVSRLFGVVLLGNGTVRALQQGSDGGNNNFGGGGGFF
jgi:protein involved in polysaccharide export with SLBB domain